MAKVNDIKTSPVIWPRDRDAISNMGLLPFSNPTLYCLTSQAAHINLTVGVHLAVVGREYIRERPLRKGQIDRLSQTNEYKGR